MHYALYEFWYAVLDLLQSVPLPLSLPFLFLQLFLVLFHLLLFLSGKQTSQIINFTFGFNTHTIVCTRIDTGLLWFNISYYINVNLIGCTELYIAWTIWVMRIIRMYLTVLLHGYFMQWYYCYLSRDCCQVTPFLLHRLIAGLWSSLSLSTIILWWNGIHKCCICMRYKFT